MNSLSPAVLLLALILPVAEPAQDPPIPKPSFQVGQAFPDIALPSLADGRPVSISDFRGKKVILHIFASW